MKRFQSRLNSLRRLKDQQEQLAGTQAAAAQQRHQRAQEAVSERKRQLEITNQSMRQLQRRNVGAEIFQGMMQLYHRQQAEFDAALQAAAAAEREADQARDAWTESRRDLKAIEQRIDTERREHRRHELIQEEHRRQETTAQAFFERSNSENGVRER